MEGADFFKQIKAKWTELNKAYWEACEKFEKSAHVPIFTNFITPLEEKGVSSLLVLIGIILILVGGVTFFTLQQNAFSSSVFTVKVLAEDGTPVNGVQVTLTADDGSSTQTSPAINGIATFSLPAGKRYSLAVSGELEPSTNVVVIQLGHTQVIRLLTKPTDPTSFILVTDSLGSAVQNAVVEYSFNQTTKSTRSNATGYAPLFISNIEENVPISGTVTSAGFESAEFSFTVMKGKVQRVTLLQQLAGRAIDLTSLAIQRHTISSPLNATAFASASVSVNQLSDSGFQPVANAYVALYNGFSKTLIAEAHTDAAGVGAFNHVPIDNDFNIYAVVEADGFLTFVTDQVKFQRGMLINATLTRANANNSIDFLVKLRDSSGAPSRGDVYVISTQGSAVISTKSNVNGQVVFRQLPKQNFYIAVTSANTNSNLAVAGSGSGGAYARFVSSLITPADSQEFTANLKQANATSTASLSVAVTDFEGHAVSIASLNLFIATVLSPPEARSNSIGSATFSNVPLGLPIVVKAEKNSFVGQTTLTLTGNTNATLVLKPPTGTVALSVLDYTSNQPLANADVKLFYKSTPTELVEVPSNCTLTLNAPSCTLPLMSTVTYVARASLNGFYSTSVEFQATPFSHVNVPIKLFPSSFSQQSLFLGLFDTEDGHKLDAASGENLSVGKVYAAKFSIKTNKALTAANAYGLYVRLGDAAQSLYSSSMPAGIAFISEEFSPSGSPFYAGFANASTTYYSGACDSTLSSTGLGLYKWVFAGGSPATAAADFQEVNVPIAAIAPGSTKLEYFTLTTFTSEDGQNEQNGQNSQNGQQIGRVIREPTDITLGEALSSTSGKKWCDSRTQSIQLNVEKKGEVKCNAYACIKTWLTQGETPSTTYFQAQATDVVHQNLDLHYSILDFQQTSTVLSFSPPSDVLKLDAATTQPSDSVDTGANTFNLALNSFKSTGVISSIVQPLRASQQLSLTYGNKISSNSINLEVLAPPAPAVNLAPLGTRYEISYDKLGQKLQLLDERARPAQQIDMYTDPLLPADAVFVYLNYSSSPCDSGENNFQQVLIQESSCFELSNVPSELVDTPPIGLKLLKYDASTPACSSHSIDLNHVNEASAKITVQHACSPASLTFDIKVKQRPELAGVDLYKALSTQVVFTEPTNDLGEGTNPFDETPHSLWALLVNRQYSKEEKVNIGGVAGYLLDQNNGQGIYQSPGSTSVKSTKLDGRDFSQELGISTPAFLSVLFTNGVKDKQIQADFQNLRQQVGVIANNTVFRRAPPNCAIDPNCKLKTFPYSVFQPNKDFSFQLGAGYLGTNREHKANFETVTSQSADQQGKAQQGVYALSIDYSKDANGAYVWTPKATGLSISPVDYYDAACGQETTTLAFPGAMSWRNGNCLQTCGDGTYFDQQQGDSGQLCDRNTFAVSKFETAVSSMKVIHLAEELGACYTVGCAATLTCSIIAQHICEAALTAKTAACTTSVTNPYSAAACAAATAEVISVCSPKASECAFTAGTAAVGGTVLIQQALENPVTTCDLVSESVIGVAGAVVNYGVIGAYFTPLKTTCTASIPANAPLVGSDSFAGAEIVSGACNALVGTRFLGLLSSWIINGATDNSALPDRTYVDINGKSCTSWHSNLASYFVYQDCNFASLWARQGRTETCAGSNNIKLFTKQLDHGSGKITFKIKS